MRLSRTPVYTVYGERWGECGVSGVSCLIKGASYRHTQRARAGVTLSEQHYDWVPWRESTSERESGCERAMWGEHASEREIEHHRSCHCFVGCDCMSRVLVSPSVLDGGRTGVVIVGAGAGRGRPRRERRPAGQACEQRRGEGHIAGVHDPPWCYSTH